MDIPMALLSYLNLIIYMVSTQKFKGSVSVLSKVVAISHVQNIKICRQYE